MEPDPTDEILAIRRKLEAQFGHDSRRIFEDILRKQRESGRTYITLPPRPPQPDAGPPPAQPETEAA